MSDKDLARRTSAEVFFGGVDITNSIQPYLLSLSYTDNEEDAADDLQISLQDRENIWLEKWLDVAIQAAAASPSVTGTPYKVTAQSGLNVRSGPGTNHGKVGSLAYGTQVNVLSVSNGWARIKYNSKDAYISEKYVAKGSGTDVAATSATTVKGLRIQSVIVRENWNSDGKDKVLDCGQFELDNVDASGPPATITIKGTSLPYVAQIRQVKKNHAWESISLSGIAKQLAANNGMACLYESAYDPKYTRVEQVTMSDIAFLSILCHDGGISLKITNNIIVLFDQAAYEAKAPVLTIERGDGTYSKYKLQTGKADTQYASCRVRYTDPSTGKTIKGIAYTEDYKADDEDNQQLEIWAKVNSIGEAKTLAYKRLRLQNKYEKSATFTIPGNPDIMAGVTVMLEGWGAWSGKYIVSQSKHSIGDSGYTTQIQLRKVLEGY
jgi:phage protein D